MLYDYRAPCLFDISSVAQLSTPCAGGESPRLLRLNRFGLSRPYSCRLDSHPGRAPQLSARTSTGWCLPPLATPGVGGHIGVLLHLLPPLPVVGTLCLLVDTLGSC